MSGVAQWVTAIAAGGLTVLDVATAGDILRNPGAILDSSRRLLSRPAYAGTTLRVRMVYRSDDAPSSVLRIRVFGAAASTDALWTALPNLAGDRSVEMTLSTDDPVESYDPGGLVPEVPMVSSNVHPTRHVWDSAGFAYFLIGVERAYPVSGFGDADDAYLEARMV